MLSMQNQSVLAYKYRAGEAALRCLADGSLYFAAQDKLNDTLEAKFDLAESSVFLDTLASTLSEVASRKSGNDIVYLLSKDISAAFDALHKGENQRFREAAQNVGIFSASIRPDNQALWAYYCNNSKGVCFELEWSVDIMVSHQFWMTQVEYTEKPRLINRANILREMILEIEGKHPDWPIEQIQDFSLSEVFRREWGIRTVANAVSIKHDDWQHEQELRLLSSNFGAIPLISNVLKRVFFVRTDFPEWGPIMMLLNKNYPHVELVQVIFQHRDPFVRLQPMSFRTVELNS